MQQWQSAIFSAALGFVAGLMGDPIRAYLSNAVHRRQMRIELYRDMIRTYNELVAIVYQVTTYPERLPHLRDSILRYLRGDLLRHFHKPTLQASTVFASSVKLRTYIGTSTCCGP